MERENSAKMKAENFQGNQRYPNVDIWEKVLLKEGTLLVQSDYRDKKIIEMRSETVSCFFSDMESLKKCENENGKISAKEFAEGVQVRPHRMVADVGEHSYTGNIVIYEAKKDIEVEVAKAKNNPIYGEGGLNQYYIPIDPEKLLKDNYLELKRIEISIERSHGLPFFKECEIANKTDREIDLHTSEKNQELLNKLIQNPEREIKNPTGLMLFNNEIGRQEAEITLDNNLGKEISHSITEYSPSEPEMEMEH